MKKGDLLFVYGTLRKGESADLSGNMYSTFVGTDRINALIFNLGWYPGVQEVVVGSFDPEAPAVTGDVFRLLDDKVVAHLDAYEGYPHLYNRIETETEKGEIVWVYTYNGDVSSRPRIEGGNWVERPKIPVQA